MATAQAAGASPIIAVNYGTGTAALAAGWVQDANVTKGYGIKWWEVGNENYGNGTYGANWEADSHCTDASRHGDPGRHVGEPDLQLRPGRLCRRGARLHLRDEGGRPRASTSARC